MKKKLSQNDKVLRYMRTHKRGITPRDAINQFECYRLSGRIYDLRRMGYNIVTLDDPNLTNSGTHARYILRESD